jgi:uncharacterized protein YdhG (YjbR/CyaY superfamily)
MSPTKTAAKKAAKTAEGFSAEERAAARARVKELKAQQTKAEGETAALAAIAEMQEPDRSMAKRIHAIIKAHAPALSAKTWYGMPAYADEEGNVICFFQPAQKFKARYSTFGFNDRARLDEGNLWPIAFALKQLTASDEARITALVKKAVSGA